LAITQVKLAAPTVLKREKVNAMFESIFSKRAAAMPTATTALPGRATPMITASEHFVFGTPLKGPYAKGTEIVYLGLGCFWGAERKFWQLPRGIEMTAVGYQAGFTPNPTYDEVCTGNTGHNEVVLVAYRPDELSFADLLKTFWECHNPTMGMRQGNDVGTQYRSAIYTTTPAQLDAAMASRTAYDAALKAQGFSPITTEIMAAPTFYYAEEYHQQYLAKVPHGYCGLKGTGVTCQLP
jgi:peptide-methionine (S)-S-oxide reductase